MTKLYDYYNQQTIAPTFADLRDETAIDAYAAAREALLTQCLALPVGLLRGASILEYGPDTGENAVAFARWGARMTLVEPAVAAHERIRSYFDRFAPAESLVELVAADVGSFRSDRRYDLIVAEGFIYTVQPTALWLDSFARDLDAGGLALVTFYERAATLIELSQKVPFAALWRSRGGDPVTVARDLYGARWDRIPHTRAFESWVMDVLRNPFVRLGYFIDAESLVHEADRHGFEIHSSWPFYRDGLENYWAKRRTTARERRDSTSRHIRHSILSFVLGTKAYLVDEIEAASAARLVEAILVDTDAAIDGDDPIRSGRLATALRDLSELAARAAVVVESRDAFDRGLRTLRAWAQVHDLLACGRHDDVVERFAHDEQLLDGWGNPNHFAVFRKRAASVKSVD